MRKFDPMTVAALSYQFENMLGLLDPAPGREGLKETPRRAALAWEEWTSGYGQDPQAVIKAFTDGAEGYDEMVVVRGIPFYSHCEHHLAPIIGTAAVGYLPDKKVLGLSKMPRIVEIFARRLQVQERMTKDIAEALMQGLAPKGVGVVVRARHMCMESRGVRLPGTETVTSSLLGNFREGNVRSEFLELVR
jgi:GTP cyclohydrolase I